MLDAEAILRPRACGHARGCVDRPSRPGGVRARGAPAFRPTRQHRVDRVGARRSAGASGEDIVQTAWPRTARGDSVRSTRWGFRRPVSRSPLYRSGCDNKGMVEVVSVHGRIRVAASATKPLKCCCMVGSISAVSSGWYCVATSHCSRCSRASTTPSALRPTITRPCPTVSTA